MNYKFTYEYIFEPSFSDIDSYGVAHHSRFFTWFENARFHFLINILQQPIDEQIKFPVTFLECKFSRTVLFGKKYKIITKFEYCEEHFKLRFTYRLVQCKREILCAKGYTEHVILDCDGNMCKELADDILKKLAEML